MVHFSLNIKAWCLYVIWEKQDQIWAKFFCIPKNMHSRTPMIHNIQDHHKSLLTSTKDLISPLSGFIQILFADDQVIQQREIILLVSLSLKRSARISEK